MHTNLRCPLACVYIGYELLHSIENSHIFVETRRCYTSERTNVHANHVKQDNNNNNNNKANFPRNVIHLTCIYQIVYCSLFCFLLMFYIDERRLAKAFDLISFQLSVNKPNASCDSTIPERR
jgi:hypothetical protein